MQKKHKELGAALSAAPVFYIIYALTLYDGEVLSISFSTDYQQLLLLVLIYPVLEELAFRGFIQTKLINWCGNSKTYLGLSIPNAITSLIFAGVHIFSQPIMWSAAVFIPSLVFGYFRDSFNSTKPCIVLHVFYNAGFFLVFGFATKTTPP